MNKVEIHGFCAIWAFERYHNDKFLEKDGLRTHKSVNHYRSPLFGSLAFEEGRKNDEGE